MATYVELKGYKNGEHGDKLCQNGTAKSSLDDIAKELNISKRNLQRALRIERNLTDSMKELLDTGEITKIFASDTIASLSKEENIEPVYPNYNLKRTFVLDLVLTRTNVRVIITL